MTDLRRPRPPFPYDLLPAVPAFTLESTDIAAGARIADRFTAAAGESLSPDLSWSGFPEGTASFAVSCFDPDAPTPSGWWHWMVVDLDASTTCLPQGAGASDLMLDGAAFHLRVDSGDHAWFGPYPPAGDGDHRYIFAVHALDVETLGLDDEATPTMAAFQMAQHTLARATLTAVYSIPGEAGAEPFLQGPA